MLDVMAVEDCQIVLVVGPIDADDQWLVTWFVVVLGLVHELSWLMVIGRQLVNRLSLFEEHTSIPRRAYRRVFGRRHLRIRLGIEAGAGRSEVWKKSFLRRACESVTPRVFRLYIVAKIVRRICGRCDM